MRRVRAGFPAPLLALVLGCSSGSPEGPACARLEERTSDVRISHRPFAALVRTDLSLRDIRALAGGPGTGRLQGLTVVEHAFERRWKRNMERSRRRGRLCVTLSDLTVDLTPTKAEIYVPSEYPDGSCEREEVLRHEREHEQAHGEALEAFAERLRSAVYRAEWLPVHGAPLEVADEAEADQRLDRAFEKVLRPAHEEFLQQIADRNATLDDPGNYRWVTARCSGWK